MSTKYRSKVDYAAIYASDKQGYNTGLDASIFIREEATPRTFNPPRIGTRAMSVSDAAPETDISGGTNTTLKVSVAGKAPVTVVLVVAGLTTGTLIAAALELKTNTALAAAGFDERVVCDYGVTAAGKYAVVNQFTGEGGDVVITAGTSNDVSADLKLGDDNGGTETDGTNDQDFFLYTTGGPTFSQPIESNAHRSGRYHTGPIKKKKVVEFDMDGYVNMSGDAGDSIDNAVSLLIEACMGTKTVNAGVSIDFTQGLPNKYLSMVRVSTIFGEYFTGCYVRGMNISGKGDGPATMKFTGKGADCSVAGIAKLNGAVNASTSVVLTAGQSKRYTAGARVMCVSTDGRTITDGADGALYVASVSDSTETVVLSAAVTLADLSYLVPWHPGAIQQTGRDAIATDLSGSVKLDSASSAIDVTEWSLDYQNDHNDLDNRFGADTNKGYVAGNRATATLSVSFDLSNETFGDVVRCRDFGGFAPQLILGPETGRHLKITAAKWIPSVPAIELPESGTTPTTLEGVLYQSAPGARDPLTASFR